MLEEDLAPAAQHDVQVARDDGARVGADAHEARVADGELPGHAVDDVERERHHDVDHREERELTPRGVGDDALEADLEADHGRYQREGGEEAPERGGHLSRIYLGRACLGYLITRR